MVVIIVMHLKLYPGSSPRLCPLLIARPMAPIRYGDSSWSMRYPIVIVALVALELPRTTVPSELMTSLLTETPTQMSVKSSGAENDVISVVRS